jgi:predicted DNA-binding transcriptional regulator YafY
MHDNLTRYIGHVIRMTYIDGKGSITDRRIRVISVDDDRLKAFCLIRRAPRVFKLGNVLAVMPLHRWAG